MARTLHSNLGARQTRRGALVASAGWMALAATLAVAHPAQAAQTGPGLPLKRGAYAEAGVQCGNAGSADLSWFGGGYLIQSPHARCTLKSATRLAGANYLVVERCLANDDPAQPFRLVNRIHVVSPRQYRLSNRNGHFISHWCRD